MPLSSSELQALVRLITHTREHEIDCSQCLSLVAQFAEAELAGKSIDEGLLAVEHHLTICSECREEYEALRSALEDLES